MSDHLEEARLAVESTVMEVASLREAVVALYRVVECQEKVIRELVRDRELGR